MTGRAVGIVHRRFERAQALARSVAVYHARYHLAGLTTLYRDSVTPGDLVFDIGAHVGDRVRVFRSLGARVIAFEPQPDPYWLLVRLFGEDPGVTLVNAAVSEKVGAAQLSVNSVNPTVSTLSPDFVAAADGALGWDGQVWDRQITVPTTTLDVLIARHGMPAFVKIDVEGHEADVLRGLSTPVTMLSFEVTTHQRDVALDCLDQLAGLGAYRFRAVLGEIHSFVQTDWVSGQEIADWITNLPDDANSGDVYARLVP